MADFFVDRILDNEELKKDWCKMTKNFIKASGYQNMLNLFLEVATEVNQHNFPNNKLPDYVFKNNISNEHVIKITEIADKFGIKPLGRNLRVCPFHADTNPSLSLSNEKGVFNCFGCGAKGNLITFNAMLKERFKNESNN